MSDEPIETQVPSPESIEPTHPALRAIIADEAFEALLNAVETVLPDYLSSDYGSHLIAIRTGLVNLRTALG